jgi:cell division protein FtsZ
MNNSNSLSDEGLSLIIVGVGNGGGNTLQTMARLWQNGPRLVAVNTDQRAVSALEGVSGIYVGEKVLRGSGTGGDPRVARQAAESESEKLSALFNGIDLAIFAVGLGGGAGSGIAPFLIEEARKKGALTLAFAMLPFEFEGLRRKEQAERGLQALRDVADGVICLPNQRLMTLVKDKANFEEAFREAQTVLARGVREFWRILSRSSIINFNFADLRAFLQNSHGNCIFCCSEGEGENRIETVLEGIRKSVLLNNCQSLAEADSFVVCVVGGDDLAINDVETVVKGILVLGRKDALAMTGVGSEPGWRQKIHVTILATEKGSTTAAGRDAARQPAREPGKEQAEAEKHAMIQTGLFDDLKDGRFKGVMPTIVDGNNLDIPTFIRRRIQVQKARITHG